MEVEPATRRQRYHLIKTILPPIIVIISECSEVFVCMSSSFCEFQVAQALVASSINDAMPFREHRWFSRRSYWNSTVVVADS